MGFFETIGMAIGAFIGYNILGPLLFVLAMFMLFTFIFICFWIYDSYKSWKLGRRKITK